MIELQCSVLRDDADLAEQRVSSQADRLQNLVATTYQQTLASDPEKYLHLSLHESGVTLELLADLYQQLQNAGVLKDVEIRDACELFEHLRKHIYRRAWPVPRFRNRRKPLLERLRYLIAAVEDVNRIESLKLLINDARRQGVSLKDLRLQIQQWIDAVVDRKDATMKDGFVAYRFI